jgi:hypothetical protein
VTIPEGDNVGDSDGCIDGIMEVEVVMLGSIVGREDKTWVGTSEGILEGFVDDSHDGWSDGKIVAFVVGDVDGKVVGFMLGE